MHVDLRERARIVLGAGLGIALAAWFSHVLGGGAAWIVAPLGASAVLVFGVPASPLAQPWSVVGGNTASACTGILCASLFADLGPAGSAAIAVAMSIGVMFALRCLHPPGGAMGMTMVLSHVTDWHFALTPVLLNSVLLVAAGIAYNSATGRRYPHPQIAALTATPPSVVGPVDLDAALAHYNQVLDLPRDQLEGLVQQAEVHAYRRRMTTLRCSDVMSREVIAVEFGTLLEDAWALMRSHRIKALPVLDRVRRVVGIVTLADFMREAQVDLHEGFDARLRGLIQRSGLVHSSKPEVVGQIMTRQVRVASEDRPAAELLPLFASTGHHHLPIIDADQRIVGMMTQLDIVTALCAPEVG